MDICKQGNYDTREYTWELVEDPNDSGSKAELYNIQNWPRVEGTVFEGSELLNIGMFNSICRGKSLSEDLTKESPVWEKGGGNRQLMNDISGSFQF